MHYSDKLAHSESSAGFIDVTSLRRLYLPLVRTLRSTDVAFLNKYLARDAVTSMLEGNMAKINHHVGNLIRNMNFTVSFFIHFKVFK